MAGLWSVCDHYGWRTHNPSNMTYGNFRSIIEELQCLPQLGHLQRQFSKSGFRGNLTKRAVWCNLPSYDRQRHNGVDH